MIRKFGVITEIGKVNSSMHHNGITGMERWQSLKGLMLEFHKIMMHILHKNTAIGEQTLRKKIGIVIIK